MAEWVRSLNFSALNHSIISPPYLVKVRAPHWPHVRQAQFCLRVCQVVFPGYSRFAPPTDWLVFITTINELQNTVSELQAQNTQLGEEINQINRNYLRIKKPLTGKRQVTNSDNDECRIFKIIKTTQHTEF